MNTTPSSHTDEKPLYNSRIIDNYIKLIRKKYSFINVNELLRYAQMKPYEVADQGHWFNQRQIDLFHEHLSKLSQNENIAREAGRFGASPESSGVMRQFFLGMVGPSTAYEMISKGASNFTRATTYHSRKIAPHKIEIVSIPKKGVNEKPFQCENRTGYLEAIAMMFGNKLPHIEHPECIHRGDPACRYIISLEKKFSDSLRKVRNIKALALIPVFALLGFHFTIATATVLVPTAVAIFLILTSLADARDKAELQGSLNNLKYSTDQLVEQINLNYNNALLTNEIGQALSHHTSVGDILNGIVKVFKKRLDYDRCMILLADSQQQRLLFRAGYGYTEEQLQVLKKTAFHLDKPNSKGVFVVSFREQKPFLINDLNELEGSLSLRSMVVANKLGSQSFICCPILCDGRSLGILAVDNLKSKKPLVHSDMSLIIGIASVLGISLRNADLLESKERQFRSILQTLAASIDARDPMTSGHSEKVTEYALGICDELELSKEYTEMIRVAALLHDYGKIGVPDNILKKPGRLTEEEYEIVKTHAEKTKRILRQINFEGIFSQVPIITGAHHEKYNGTGYPKGLKGEEIPLGARIIAVADFFEAITSRRHYREPMQLKRALQLLSDESGKRFDGRIVEAFFRYYSKTHAGEPAYRMSIA